MASYDVIIVGLGGMGSATAYHLARRGARILGVEQYGVFYHDMVNAVRRAVPAAVEQVLAKVEHLPHLLLINKSDLPQAIEMGLLNGSPKVHLSAKTGHGLDTLRDAIRAILMDGKTDLTDDLVLTNSRQHEAIRFGLPTCSERTASPAGASRHPPQDSGPRWIRSLLSCRTLSFPTTCRFIPAHFR